MRTDTGSMVLFRPTALGREVAHLIQRRKDVSLHFSMIGALLHRGVCGLVMGPRSPVSVLYHVVEGYRPVSSLLTSMLIEGLEHACVHRHEYFIERGWNEFLLMNSA